MKLRQALELALAQLGPFAESSLYEDYKAEDGFTDAQWDEMMEKLRSLASMGESVLDRARTQIRDGILYSYRQGDLCESPEATIDAIGGLIGDSYDTQTGEVSDGSFIVVNDKGEALTQDYDLDGRGYKWTNKDNAVIVGRDLADRLVARFGGTISETE